MSKAKKNRNNGRSHIQKFVKANRALMKKLVVVADGDVHTVWHSENLTCHMMALNGYGVISFRITDGHRQFSDADILCTRLRALWSIANRDLRVTDWRLYERRGSGSLHFDFVKRPPPYRDQ